MRRSQGGAKRRALAAIGVAALTLGIWAGAPAAAAPGDAFPADESLIFLSQGSNPTQLYRYVQGPTGFTTELEGSTSGYNYNAMGYHLASNFLYAVRLGDYAGDTQILQIGQEGGVEEYGTLAGLPNPAPDSVFNQGTFGQGADASTFFFRLTGDNPIGSSDLLYVVDDITDRDSETGEIPWRVIDLGSQVGNLGDMVYLQGYLWGVYGAASPSPRIIRIDPDPGAGEPRIRTWTFTGLPGGDYGGMWIFGNGNLGLSHNPTGDIYQLSIAEPASDSPGFAVVATLGGPDSILNDGTSSFQTPVDLGIEKTGSAYVPGEAFDFELTVTNHSPGTTSSGHLVMDEVPEPLVIESTSDGCAVDDDDPQQVTCSAGELGPEEQIVHTITVVAPAEFTACITNTASVLGNDLDTDDANDSDSVETCIQPPTVSLRAVWVDAADGDASTLTINGSGATPSEAPDGDGVASAVVLAGVPVTLGQVFADSNALDYDAVFACDGIDVGDDATFIAPATDVDCTVTNTVRTADAGDGEPGDDPPLATTGSDATATVVAAGGLMFGGALVLGVVALRRRQRHVA